MRKSPCLFNGPDLPNSENEYGATISARSNNSGWLQTSKYMSFEQSAQPCGPRTYLAELHDKIHERTGRVGITDIGSFCKQICNGHICLQGLVHCALARAEINVNVLLNLHRCQYHKYNRAVKLKRHLLAQ